MPRQPWTEEQKSEALTMAASAGPLAASQKLGIPAGTIKSWQSRSQHSRLQPGRVASLQPDGTKNVATVRGTAWRVATYVEERRKALGDRLFWLAEKAAMNVDAAIGAAGEPHDRDGSAWVRALVGVMAQAVEKAQLLSGRPTARPEVVDRREYDITQRIIADPEAVELANQLLQRAAGRDSRAPRVDGERGQVGTV